MKKTKVVSSILLKEIHKNKRKYILFISIFFLGILFGTIMTAISNSFSEIQTYVDTFLSSYSLHGTSKKQVFLLSIQNYIKFSFFLWVSGWHPWVFPLCFLQVFSKGFRIGYTTACFVQCYRLKGIILSFTTLLLQNTIFLPAMLASAVYQFQFLSDRKYIIARKTSPEFRKQLYLKYIVCLFFYSIILILCSFLEGYVIPVLLRPLCRFWL